MPLDSQEPVRTISCLRDLQNAIAIDTTLTPARRQAIVADLGTLIRIQPATAEFPPTTRSLFHALRTFVRRAAAHGLNAKRAQNIAANTRAALRWCESGQLPIRAPRSAAWQLLWDTLAGAGENTFRKAQLSSFVRWCNGAGIEPADVSDAAVARFHEDLKTKQPLDYARDRVMAMIRCWNSLTKARADWPSVTLSLLPALPRQGTSAAAYAPAFLLDLERYRQAIVTGSAINQSKGRFDENSGQRRIPKKNRPKSADSYVSRLRRAAVLLTSTRGQPLTSVTCLQDLLGPGAPKDILEAAYEIYGESRYIADLLVSLVNVSKSYLSVSDECSARLRNLQNQLPQIEAVMSTRNRNRLRELSQADLATLYELPKKLMRSVERRLQSNQGLRRDDISNAKAAACLSILLYTPPRLNNLAKIRIGQHLMLQGHDGRLEFSAAETKQKRPWSVPVHEKTLPVLRWYVDKVLPKLGGSDPHALFPGRKSSTVSNDQLRHILSRKLEKCVQPLNPHFFRHLVAHIMLVEQPGCYHAVQLLLGHSDVETTKKFYCGEEAEAALQHIAECMSSAVNKLAGSIAPRAIHDVRRRGKC